MILIVYAGFLLLSMTIALIDWRRGWLMAVICGVLQDPVRKLTPGTPVVITLSVMAVYAMILLAASPALQRDGREFGRRFANIYAVSLLVFVFIILAALRGLFTYGIEGWKAPALSLFIYCAPVPAVLLGYAYLRREEQLYSFFRYYAIVTSIALIGTPLEYFDVQWRALGTVALSEAYIRHLPGIQIRLLSGFYRAPDVMAWHAAMLTIISLVMTMRGKLLKEWPWMLATGWGFLNCLLSGRRKAVYMVAVFVAAFFWRYVRRLTIAQIVTFAMSLAIVGMVVHKISEDEKSSVYARGTATSREEVFERLEGGMVETIREFGLLGAGLGAATQGVQHVTSTGPVGWQEGGLGKLTVELGVPGLLAALMLAIAMFRTMLKITAHPDIPGSSQLIRCAVFGIVVANVVEFMASAQAYSDAVLTLMTAFFFGCMFATAALDERLPVPAPEPEAAARPVPATVPA
jgi:hypothetical protein